jgi:hypothetical protein
MSPIPPRQIRDAPNDEHHVFDWEVPGSGNGKAFIINGTLDYSPPNDEGVPVVFIAVLAAVLAATLAGLYLLRRRLVR